MASVPTTILSLPPTVGSLTGDEITVVVQGGETKQTAIRNIATAAPPTTFAIASLVDCADDAEAATAGVALGGIYRSSSALKVRAT